MNSKINSDKNECNLIYNPLDEIFLSACKTDICRSIVDIGFATGTSSVSASGSTLLLAVDADSYLGNYNHGL